MALRPAAPAKILLFDIETSPMLAWHFQLYESNALGVEQDWHMLSFAYQWLEDKKPRAMILPQFKDRYKKNPADDYELCLALWKLMDEADIVIGHNGDQFDIKKTYARFIVHGLKPPSPYKTIDTLKVARTYFRFDSNRLDALGRVLGVGRKMKHQGQDLWIDVMHGKAGAWKTMKQYNIQDVALLKKVYLKLRPWMKQHPNLNLFQGTDRNCPTCGKAGLIVRGYKPTRTAVHVQLQCTHCGAYCSRPGRGVVR